MSSNQIEYSKFQLGVLVTLRFIIGWHFLYEGVVKFANPNWSAAAFLRESQGIFSGFFQWIVSDTAVLNLINFLNIWLLILIGFILIAGLWTRLFCYIAVLLITLYYLAAPPWPGLIYLVPAQGNNLIIDKNLIELAALLVLIAFPTSHIIGLQRLYNKWWKGF